MIQEFFVLFAEAFTDEFVGKLGNLHDVLDFMNDHTDRLAHRGQTLHFNIFLKQ